MMPLWMMAILIVNEKEMVMVILMVRFLRVMVKAMQKSTSFPKLLWKHSVMMTLMYLGWHCPN